ncbi:protein folding regulator [Holotrichia oblita]|uniref:Protein folding regulator n=1 Tax=Holotrichia oblita TaxID=644536 RepID=A0ACB9T5L7_HOLOL|nr:protein folding regulator [Holotrichia oblita]
MNIRIFTIVLLISVQVIVCAENEDENDQDTFVPTDEWKPVKKGQKVPEGLHIRINLETGEREAKLIKKSKETDKNALSLTSSTENENGEDVIDDKLKISLSELKQSLKNIKNEAKDNNIKNKFRSRKEIDEEEILTILEDLEYLVHQYDNANEFISLNGLNEVVYKNLNSSNTEIKRESLKLLGASIQNNAMVKIHALDSGSIDILLRMIVLENDPSVKYRALFALGGLLRSFPFAQLKFIENAGLSVFFKLFDLENLKIQLKTLTIINDLLQEEIDAEHDDNKEKANQYKNVNFREHLLKNNYCNVLNKLLVNSVSIDSNDHDIIEKCLLALYTVIDDCNTSLTDKSRDIVLSLRNLYKKLSEKEKQNQDVKSDDNHDYYSGLYELSNNIVKRYQKNKDEL